MISSRFALSANLMVGSDDRRVVRGLGGYERTLLVTEGHQRKWEDKKRERRYETTRQMTCSAARLEYQTMDDSALIVNLAEKAKETASEVSRHRGPMSLNVIVDNQRLSPNGSADIKEPGSKRKQGQLMTPHSHTVVAMDPSSLTVSLLSGDSSVKSVKSFKSFNTSEGSVRRTSLSIDQQSDYPRLETSIPSGLMIHPSIKITAENSPRELLVGPRDLWLVYRLAVSDGTLGIAKEEAGKVMSLESLIDIKAFSREGLASGFRSPSTRSQTRVMVGI
ncbi:hypothetical protein NliqN6_4441 [Naganishia liquefaciens]|uniref:Uncharacterized protein n=1 Tax=Naganishia liquefaciens TaxID=104408 RepID=A0A8H3TXL2_9TREE|nr:hypothetical protein NliqN6_4441 [Naganishia liquefaciens]